MLERAKNPTEKSLVGRAMSAGRKVVAFAQDSPEMRKAKKFVGFLDYVDIKSRKFPEGTFYYRGKSYTVEQEGNDTHIISKNSLPGNGVILYDYTQIHIERDEERILSVTKLCIRTRDAEIGRVDYEPFGDYHEKVIYPLSLDATAEDRIAALRSAHTQVHLAEFAIEESKSGQFLN